MAWFESAFVYISLVKDSIYFFWVSGESDESLPMAGVGISRVQ